MVPQSLQIENFYLEFKTEGQAVHLNWKGAIHLENPGEVLNKYFENVLKFCQENQMELNCNFCNLEYMNSSSIPPLIVLLQKMSDRNIRGYFHYDLNRKIQSATFKALNVIASRFKGVTIEGIAV